MKTFKINWTFTNSTNACKAVEALGATSLTIINFYSNNKKVDRYAKMVCFESNIATLEAKKYIRRFFRKNKDLQPYCKLISS